MLESKPLLILYGTETGNSEDLAERTLQRAKELGIEARMENVFNFPPANLKDESRLALVISTWGEGDPPDEATEFCETLWNDEVSGLDNLEYTVCALGDTGYEDFCGAGRKCDEALARAGAKCILPRQECDVDFEESYQQWADKLFALLTE